MGLSFAESAQLSLVAGFTGVIILFMIQILLVATADTVHKLNKVIIRCIYLIYAYIINININTVCSDIVLDGMQG